MRYTIIAPDGVVGVDGDFRKVDLADLDPAIHAVQFDTVTGVGHIEYKRSAVVEVEVRDVAAERLAEVTAGSDRLKQAALKPMHKKVRVPRANEALADMRPFNVYVERWNAAPRHPAESSTQAGVPA